MTKFILSKEYNSSYGKISYDVKGDGPPLILVHGTPWSSFNWRHLIPALSQWYTVYYYDLLGYGQSQKGASLNVSLAIQNKVLAELLDFWKLKQPIIIGHDFGGTTVLRTILLENRVFSKVILIDPVAVAPWGSSFFKHIQEYEKAFQGIPAYIHKEMVSTYVKGACYKDMSNETLKGIIDPWLGEIGQNAFYSQIAQSSQIYTDEIEPSYKTINSSVLIIWGEQDEWIPIEKGIKLHKKIENSQFIAIANAGHLVQEDQPTLLLAHILKFLKG